MRKLLLFAFLLLFPAIATAGPCPSAANYITPSGQTSTLTQLGILHCYYVAANGSDSNTGADEAHPWRFVPGMANVTGVAAAYARQAGDAFIFRGGDIWHFGDPNQTQGGNSAGYAGIITACDYNGKWAAGLCLGGGSSIKQNRGVGNPTNPLYYGVDLNWFSGSSWSRPILTGDNPLATPASGSASDPARNLTSCAFQVGENNNLVNFDGPFPPAYIIFDNFELSGLCQAAYYVLDSNGITSTYTRPDGIPGGGDFYIEDMDLTSYLERVYAHNYSHLGFHIASNGIAACHQVGTQGLTVVGHCFAGIVIDRAGNVIQCVVDGSDSDPQGWTAEFGHSNQSITGGWNLAQSVFTYTVGIDMGPMHTIHDNLFAFVTGAGDGFAHGNLLESSGDGPNVNVYYNNVFHDMCSGTPAVPQCGSIGWWVSPPLGATDYVFNNLTYKVYVANGNYFNVGGHTGENTGSFIVFNNTFEQPQAGQGIITCSAAVGVSYSLTLANNFYIFDGTPSSVYYPYCAAHETAPPQTELIMSHPVATTAGYLPSQTFAYSPTAPNSPTVGIGTSKQAFCSALSTAAASDPTLSDAATACQSDTRYACAYNTSTHAVTCPAKVPVTRPGTAAWNVGNYQFPNGIQPPPPPQPSFVCTGGIGNSFNFGNVLLNATAQATCTLSNSSTTTLNVATSISGTGFSIVPGGNCTSLLLGGQSCFVPVQFAPTAVQSYSGTLTETATPNRVSATASLSGAGVAPALVSISPSTIAFGSQAQGTTSSPIQVTVTNTGGSPLVLGNGTCPGASCYFSITGLNAADFVVVAPSAPTWSVRQHAMGSCTPGSGGTQTCATPNFASNITAGHTLIARSSVYNGNNTAPSQPIHNGITGDNDTWKQCPPAIFKALLTTGNFNYWLVNDCYWVASATGGSKTVTDSWTFQNQGGSLYFMDVDLYEFAPSTGITAIDISASSTSSSCTTCVGPTMTATGTSDLVLPWLAISSSVSSIGAPYTLTESEGNVAAGFANATNQSSISTPSWTASTAGVAVMSNIAFTSTAVATACASGDTVPPGNSCNVQITFKPITSMVENALLTISGTVSGTANLTGTGTATPQTAAPVIAPNGGTFTRTQNPRFTSAIGSATNFYAFGTQIPAAVVAAPKVLLSIGWN